MSRATFRAFLVALALSPTLSASTETVTYSLSDGFDLIASIQLRGDGSFVFRWDGCTGPIADVHGSYVADAASVRFVPGATQFRRDSRTFAETMLRVKWGRREYLVAEERLLSFVNAINAGFEPRKSAMGNFYLRSGDEKPPAAGIPQISPHWQNYLVEKPVSGKVIRIIQRESATARPIAVIDAGSDKGFLPGMALFASNPDRPHFKAELTVHAVFAHAAHVVVNFQYNHIRVGDSWFSRAPDN